MRIGKHNAGDFISNRKSLEQLKREVMTKVLRAANKIAQNSIYGGTYITCGSEVAKIFKDAFNKEE